MSKNQPKHSGHLCHIESSLKYPSYPSWNDISYLSLCAMSSFQISRQKRSITGQYVCHLNGLHAENCMHLQRKRRQTTRVTQSDKTINRSLQVFLIRRQHIISNDFCIADISYYCHYLRFFQAGMRFNTENAKLWSILADFVANSCTFWRTFYRPK